MKRVLLLLIAWMLTAMLCACRPDPGRTDTSYTSAGKTAASETASRETGHTETSVSAKTEQSRVTDKTRYTTIRTTTIATAIVADHTTAATQTKPAISIPPLSAEMEKRIKNDYLKAYFPEEAVLQGKVDADKIHITHYFGTYNGCVVMLINGYTLYSRHEFSEEIAGITFEKKGMQGLEVWHDGKFYGLETAYERRLFLKPALEKIKEVYDNTSPIKDTAELSAEQERTIKNDYLKWSKRNDEWTVNDITIMHYFGTYNGSMVLWLDMAGARYTEGLGTENIAGVTFTYTDGQRFDVWYNGAFYHLKSAYEKGLLTKSNLEKIKEVYDHMLPVKDTVELSVKQEWTIKHDFLKAEDLLDMTIHHVSITHYFGTYNGCIVDGF